MDLYIIGAGGFAGEVIDAIQSTLTPDKITIRGLYDDDTRLQGGLLHGLPFAGTIGDFVADTPPGTTYIFAIGDNAVRSRLAEEFDRAGKTPLTVTHPSASVSPRAEIQGGSYIGAFAFVGPRTRIGHHVIVNVGASVGHDAQIADFAQLCPGARISGYSLIGRGVFLGSNAVVGPRAKVGDWAKLGAGSFAHREVPAGKLALGVPAKVVAF